MQQADGGPIDPDLQIDGQDDLLERIAAEIAFYANQPPLDIARRVVALLSELGYRIVCQDMSGGDMSGGDMPGGDPAPSAGDK